MLIALASPWPVHGKRRAWKKQEGKSLREESFFVDEEKPFMDRSGFAARMNALLRKMSSFYEDPPQVNLGEIAFRKCSVKQMIRCH